MKNNFLLIALFTWVISFSSHAANEINATCQQKNYRQFDFWLGEWQVSNTSNTSISQSKISLINQGCAILEEYSTPTGYIGKSLNIYDATRDVWHQTWVDNGALLLQLEGKFDGKSMVMSGITLDVKQQSTLNRITWTPNDNGSVRQHWETSTDQGKSWSTAFDGLYQRKLP